jgi:hypothetical protein
MDNKAYKWLSEWIENGGGWNGASVAGVWLLNLNLARPDANDSFGFREDMRKLIFYAELGRQVLDLLKEPMSIYEYNNRMEECLTSAAESASELNNG